MKQIKQIRLISFICKAKDLTTRITEEWQKLEKMKEYKKDKSA